LTLTDTVKRQFAAPEIGKTWFGMGRMEIGSVVPPDTVFSTISPASRALKGVSKMEIYDVIQVGKMLRVAPKTVRSYLRTGRLIGRKVGKRWLVAEDAVRIFLMEAEQGGDDNATNPPSRTDGQEKYW
jgi:hypothetical protein